MEEIEFTEHALDRMEKRGISEEWVRRAMDLPDFVEEKADEWDNTHYIKAIEEFGGRFLRVVVNPFVSPRRVVTLHFDRGVKRRTRRQE